MSLLKGKGVLTKFDTDGSVLAFAIFDEPPVSSSREPDAVYTKTENGWVSESGEELSADDVAELDALVAPVVVEQPVEAPESDQPVHSTNPDDAPSADETPAESTPSEDDAQPSS